MRRLGNLGYHDLMRHFPLSNHKDQSYSKIVPMMLVVFFLYFGDAILSEWIPTFMQSKLGGSLAMGLMMSFSSVVGFLADLVFPQLFKKASSRKMVLLAVSSVFITAGILLWTTHFIYPAVFLMAMGVWGLYYEFLNFGLSAYVVKTAASSDRAGVWSVITVFKSLAYCLGPLAGSWLFYWKGDVAIIVVYSLFALIAYVIWLIEGIKNRELKVDHEMEFEKVNILDEVKHWGSLFKHVWPILLVSLVLGIIDAAFWTTGVVMSDNLVSQSWVGSLFVPAYILPSIFVGFLVPKLGIHHGKKKISEIFMMVTGFLLFGLGLGGSVCWLVFLSLLIGVATSFSWPLVEAVYSDILSRMGREQKHMMGLSNSTYNVSYIIGPVIAGLLSNSIGEIGTMKYLGIMVVFVSVILLVVTPKKLKLPQSEIKQWK